ncbi:MAG: Fis family PAS modulated sigma54 specific transcriptional regulator [Candidatus Magnetoglobus multicellularis str. Araruama]|uniref:Fis family PAS modulated sigma54 specific transcriptional regulator n=1 Tax=Candidatus Magnetoglobus multicellularis str. Araruama TaxID=890399 RepID=A0A1V1NVI2_9BACT|nr:MAG: Fis family PAS modulated sigma54 specific transcriptional regulator [Candidatus Magnetoglobus multicellularis str. Araruama]
MNSLDENKISNYWKTVVDTIQDGVMIVNNNGTIISINKAFEKITGYRQEEVIGTPCTILNCDVCRIYRNNKINDKDNWCILFNKGHLKLVKCQIIRKDGTIAHISKNASLLYDENGEVMGGVETLTDVTELIEKGNQIETIRQELKIDDCFYGIIGSSIKMQLIFDLIRNAALSDAPILILGESGTGKELVAKAIHEIGSRNEKPFIKVNCAALNESLLESELFGHVKGAFTGAIKNRQGRFEAANGGDIFLDEIGDLPMSTQVKLLRVLEENVIEQVGDHKPIHIDVRIISATNKNLKKLISQGLFREDLLYRINMIPINIPPLRERKEDIPLLVDYFFKRIRVKNSKEIKGISDDSMKTLIKYSWPGNIRELKGAFEYAFVACQEDIIQAHHFTPDILEEYQPIKNSKLKKEVLSKKELKKKKLG